MSGAAGRRKYPRTLHLPWSPGVSNDDKVLRDVALLRACDEVVMTLKYDGENTTIYPDGYSHARSLTASRHPSRDYVRALAAEVSWLMPVGRRIVGENLWAVHSIAYDDLPAWFVVHSMWDEDRCMSWDETAIEAHRLALVTATVVYRGPWPGQRGLDSAFAPYAAQHEGYVVRPAGEFHASSFPRLVAKWVREGHVQTDEHWLNAAPRRNQVVRSAQGTRIATVEA